MNILHTFTVGENYTNDQIRLSLDLENLGGIRPSLDSSRNVRHVAIMTAAGEAGKIPADNPYQDRIEGNVLLYTAQGRHGDQTLTGRNKRLIEQYGTPVPFFGFTNTGRQSYRFLGMLELLRHYQESQADAKGSLRKVWLFEFRIHDRPEVVPIENAPAISAALLAESRRSDPLDSWDREIEPIAQEIKEEGTSAEIEKVRANMLQIAPYDFERFMKRVLECSGFVRVSVTRASGDGGVDVNAYVDESDDFFAGTHVQAQVKRWRHAVGSPEINGFRGALSITAKGIFVTTSLFTRAALAEARHASKPSIALIDGERLARLVVIKHIPTA
jgi:hypothetical protein